MRVQNKKTRKLTQTSSLSARMNPLFHFSIFQPMYLVTLPLGIFAVFITLFIPSMMATSNPKPEAISRAISCYILKAFGIGLIAVGAFPVLYMLLINEVMPIDSLLPLAFLFLVGTGVLVQANIVLQGVDEASVSVPRAIFHHSLEVLGGIVALISGISIVMVPLMTQKIGGWEIPASTLILSMILTLSFSLHTAPRGGRAAKAVGKKKSA